MNIRIYFRNRNKGQAPRQNSGQALMLAVIFFVIISIGALYAVSDPVLRRMNITRMHGYSKESFFAAESLADDIVTRLKNGMPVSDTETLIFDNASAESAITDVAGGKEIAISGDRSDAMRKVKISLALGSGASFHYGVQAGAGGMVLENSSSIRGNVFANGPVSGSNSNIVWGDVVSSGEAGAVSGVHATSSVYAHSISNSTIDKDAYYETIFNSSVAGALHPGSPDQAASPLPISDAQVGEWEEAAEAGGVIASPCPYKITGTATLGPKKIICDLEISGNNYTLTLNGPVWVSGNITINNGPTIQISSSLGNTSVPIIADNPSNRLTGSKIESDNSADFVGSGAANSYILLLSQNQSAESGGGETAINVANSAGGALLVYAGHGEVLLQNSVTLKEVSAYKIRLKNSAEVVYESGLANLLFSAGPSGGYAIISREEE